MIADNLVIAENSFWGVTMDNRPKLLAEVNAGSVRASRATFWSKILLLVAWANVVLIWVVPSSTWTLVSCGVLVAATLAGGVSNFMAWRRDVAINERIDEATRANLAELRQQQGQYDGR